MSEEEVFEKFVEIKVGIDEDGGGICITVRDDTALVEKLVELTIKLYKEIIATQLGIRTERRDVA